MTLEQSHQEVTKIKVLLMKCFIAESELACFLLDKAKSVDLPLDDTFRLKHMADRVKVLMRQIEASDERYHDDSSNDNVPVPLYNNP